MRPWEIIGSRYLLRRWWMNLREDHVRLPDGQEMTEFHVVEYPDWACIICLDTEGDLIMVEQYRHGVGRTSLEFPAGAIDPGEEPEVAARRELMEETGYTSETWYYLGKSAPEPSKHTNHAHVFVATGSVKSGEPSLDATEHLRVVVRSVPDVVSLADAGAFVHGTHQMALFWALRKGLIPDPMQST